MHRENTNPTKRNCTALVPAGRLLFHVPNITLHMHFRAFLLDNISRRNTSDGYIAAGVVWYYQLAYIPQYSASRARLFPDLISRHGELPIHVSVSTLVLILSTAPIDSQ